MGDSNQITVPTDQGDVVVHKMTLRDYALVLRALDKLPQSVGHLFDGKTEDLKKLDNSEIMKMIPEILAESWEDVASLLAVPTDKDGEFMLSLDGADAIDIISAIVQLNDFPRIIAAIKKMLAQRKSPAMAPAQAPAQTPQS